MVLVASGYKVNIQKSATLLYTNNEASQKEIEKNIPFTVALKTKKKK